MSTISWKEVDDTEYAYDEDGLVIAYIKSLPNFKTSEKDALCTLFYHDYKVGTYITRTHAKQSLYKKSNQIALKAIPKNNENT